MTKQENLKINNYYFTYNCKCQKYYISKYVDDNIFIKNIADVDTDEISCNYTQLCDTTVMHSFGRHYDKKTFNLKLFKQEFPEYFI